LLVDEEGADKSPHLLV